MLLGYQRAVVGFHGCDRSLAEDVVLGRAQLQPSDNRYDWLGRGVYFWEHGPQRALQFAQWKASRGELAQPAVLGAVIELGRCFDLADTWATAMLRDFHEDVLTHLALLGSPLPSNRPGRPGDFDLIRRDRDCAVINFGMAACDQIEGDGNLHFQTVRGIFVEGGPAFDGAGIQQKSHVQIAVRDSNCISHFFLPRAGLGTSRT